MHDSKGTRRAFRVVVVDSRPRQQNRLPRTYIGLNLFSPLNAATLYVSASVG
jgi:hypothetical protein